MRSHALRLEDEDDGPPSEPAPTDRRRADPRIADLLEANQQLVLATMRAREAEEALRHKDEFLAMLGHELRNPLSPIRSAAGVLGKVAGDDPRLTWVHDVIVRQVGHITRLVDDLLDISLMARSALKLSREPVDVVQAIAHAVETTEPLLQRKRHRLTAKLGDAPVWVDGDAIRLAQVFENLLGNAAKYTDSGGELSVAIEVVDETAVVRLRDNGVGISAGMNSRVFDLFVQDARALDRSEGGLGIGLALVRHLVALHGGTIEARSAGVGQGTEMVVRLPLLAAGQVPVGVAPTPTAGAGRVLIVDDDPDVGEALGFMLELFGYDVARAWDADSALRVGPEFRPDAVLLDIGLPGDDGYEVARRLRALPGLEGAVFIALSGFPEPEPTPRTAAAGFAAYLLKPADPVELSALLARRMQAR